MGLEIPNYACKFNISKTRKLDTWSQWKAVYAGA